MNNETSQLLPLPLDDPYMLYTYSMPKECVDDPDAYWGRLYSAFQDTCREHECFTLAVIYWDARAFDIFVPAGPGFDPCELDDRIWRTEPAWLRRQTPSVGRYMFTAWWPPIDVAGMVDRARRDGHDPSVELLAFHADGGVAAEAWAGVHPRRPLCDVRKAMACPTGLRPLVGRLLQHATPAGAPSDFTNASGPEQ